MMLLALACAAPSIVMVYGAALRRREAGPWWMWLVLPCFALGAAGVPFIWRLNIAYAIPYAVLAYATSFVVAAVLSGVQWASGTIGDLICGAHALAFGIMIPIAVIPYVRASFNPAIALRNAPPIDAGFIRRSTEQIQGSMNGAVRDIQREQNRVELATKQLVQQVETQNALINDLQKERAELTRQVEFQRVLAALTKPQADSVRDSLTRGKYVDYFRRLPHRRRFVSHRDPRFTLRAQTASRFMNDKRWYLFVVRRFVIASAIFFLFAQADGVANRDRLLQRGKEEYRAAQYDAAIEDLREAAAQYVGDDEKRVYIETGNLPTLPRFEEALVYLALANAKLGRDADAHDAVERLFSAERIASTYKTLPLERDASDFEPLAARLITAVRLPANDQLAQFGVQPTPAPLNAPPPSVTEERTAFARAVQEQEPDENTALAPVVPRHAQASIPEPELETKSALPAIIRKAPPAPAPVPVKVKKIESIASMLRRAESAVRKGNTSEASRLYEEVATSSRATREAIATASIGLYRLSNYSAAVNAFNRLGTFAHGEEDLRYYDAVSLYEIGRYDEARRQLACALPYLETNDAVRRYRARIEQTSLQ